MNLPAAAPAPAAAVLLKLDTLGDLVLFAPSLRALRAAWPATRLAVVVRRAYLDLAPLLAPEIEWIPTNLDPFATGPEAGRDELERLRSAVAAVAPAVVAAATSRRNWLEAALAHPGPLAPGTAAHAAARRIVVGSDAADAFFAVRLRTVLGLDAATVFNERIPESPAGSAPGADAAPDWRTNFRLVSALAGRELPPVPPAVEPGPAARAAAAAFLAAHGLAPGRYVACAAAGFANVRLKTWPPDRFAAVLRHAADRHGLPAVLVGHESERDHLEAVRTAFLALPPAAPSAAAPAASAAPVLWLGRDGSLPELAAVLAAAAAFVGNDTGALHLAAATGIPVVGVFGGGTWPRFVPAAARGAAVVHPLPCFGCGWDCPFGDAPCLGAIPATDVAAALDASLAGPAAPFGVRSLAHLPPAAAALAGRAAALHREAGAGHLARQHKLEELKALADAKDAEIAALKQVCDEREKTIFVLDGHVRNFQGIVQSLGAERDVLQKTLAALPADAAKAAQTIADQVVHIRNIEALLKQRDAELAELRHSAANRTAGLHDLEQAKHYQRLLAERDTAVYALRAGVVARDRTIAALAAAGPLGKFAAWLAHTVRERLWRPADTWLFRQAVERYWMQIGVLRHYDPRPLRWDERLADRPAAGGPAGRLPQIAVVTPSFNQEKFLERTLRSVLDQAYPKLRYVVQDGASRDGSPALIGRYAARLHSHESVPDRGQADAIRRGFDRVVPELGPDDVMAWLNSDDLLAPGALRFVADYFAAHPEVDAVYGHRIIIDDEDREVGRWVMPRHDPATLAWIDYVPQETLFWRRRAWDLAGGIDPTFQFALDWDLLARFQQAGCRLVRVPYFLGAFRVHAEQKTSQAIHTVGAEEMRRIRTRFHGERQDDFETIHRFARRTRFRGAIVSRLLEVGLRW